MESTILCLIDIDHFKSINDTFGHSAGDGVLKSFVDLLKHAIRQNDVIIRWGGEEFLLVMPNISREAAAEILERIRVNIESHSFTENNQNIQVTASLGFTPYPLLRDSIILDWEQTLELADFCLYSAKHGGRNAWVGITELHIDEPIAADTIIKDAKRLVKQNKLQAISNREDIINSL
jgi:diguanylate cyclase (GGDEF)-like protein